MPSLSQTIGADQFRYGVGTGGSAFRRAYREYPGFRYTYYMRKVAHYASRKRSLAVFVYAYYRWQLGRYRFRYGFDISPTTAIGPGLYIGHFGGVVISPDAVLGASVNIAQGVTIGAESRGARKGAPVLGDRVWVGANAVIVGRVTIGDDALIAPGAFVNFDVPAMAVVVGNPGKVVSDKGSVGYVNNVLGEAAR